MASVCIRDKRESHLCLGDNRSAPDFSTFAAQRNKTLLQADGIVAFTGSATNLTRCTSVQTDFPGVAEWILTDKTFESTEPVLHWTIRSNSCFDLSPPTLLTFDL
ncbi:hypothetical protein RRG08_034052 [Elysia crispata]|uniref:Uncharacterized protein n=1 Tax=Elysia crispata TaxID=231223 RepID=A0AAE0YKP8_9GAST|nr:hypothetical protein RRG08_034052 [Elysia crispata]